MTYTLEIPLLPSTDDWSEKPDGFDFPGTSEQIIAANNAGKAAVEQKNLLVQIILHKKLLLFPKTGKFLNSSDFLGLLASFLYSSM